MEPVAHLPDTLEALRRLGLPMDEDIELAPRADEPTQEKAPCPQS